MTMTMMNSSQQISQQTIHLHETSSKEITNQVNLLVYKLDQEPLSKAGNQWVNQLVNSLEIYSTSTDCLDWLDVNS